MLNVRTISNKDNTMITCTSMKKHPFLAIVIDRRRILITKMPATNYYRRLMMMAETIKVLCFGSTVAIHPPSQYSRRGMQHAVIKASVHSRTEWGVGRNQTPYFQRCSCNSRHWSEYCIDSNHGGQLFGHFSMNDTITTSERHQTSPAWRYGLELGIYMFLGYAFHAIGLETTSASRSGFLLYFNLNFKLQTGALLFIPNLW